MEVSRLAAKQKRYKEILHFTETEVPEGEVKTRLLSTLATYRSALAACWSTPTPQPEADNNILSLERSLMELHNQARLTTAQRCLS